MADTGRLVDLNELLSQVDAEFFDIASRDVDSDEEHEQLGHPEGIEQLDEDVLVKIEADKPSTSQTEKGKTKTKQGDKSSDSRVLVTKKKPTRPTQQSIPTSSGDGPSSPSGDTGDETISKRQNVLSTFRCKCATNCLTNFDISSLLDQMVFYESLTTSERDVMILSKVSVVINTSATHGKTHKHKERERKRTRCDYAHEG